MSEAVATSPQVAMPQPIVIPDPQPMVTVTTPEPILRMPHSVRTSQCFGISCSVSIPGPATMPVASTTSNAFDYDLASRRPSIVSVQSTFNI